MKKARHLIVRSRNTSCKELRKLEIPARVIYRMGSTTPTTNITKRTDYIEINSPEACAVSGDKILMKQKFNEFEVPTAEWFTATSDEEALNLVTQKLEEWRRIIIKHKHSSKGNGIYFITTLDEYNDAKSHFTSNIKNYIFERYYTYSKEYRLHVNENGCFYTCRKMLKEDAEVRWHRHENNSVWILEDNPMFDKPDNWENIVEDCKKAIKAVGLDIGACDVKVQTHVENPKYIILETNSAPALGEIGIEKYKDMLTKYINEKRGN